MSVQPPYAPAGLDEHSGVWFVVDLQLDLGRWSIAPQIPVHELLNCTAEHVADTLCRMTIRI